MLIRILSLAALLSKSAAPHDLYVMPGNFRPTAGSAVTISFHVGDSFPESEVSPKLERLRDTKLLWNGGEQLLPDVRKQGKKAACQVVVKGGGELLATGSTSPALIHLDARKFSEYLKEEGLASVLAWRASHGESDKPGKERYSKYAKSILLVDQPNAFSTRSVGFVIEIVPEIDPLSLKPGQPLPIRVLFRGRPVEGQQIETSWVPQGRPGSARTTVVGLTGRDGRFDVPISGQGTWRIHTVHMERCHDPAVADWESFWASLTFELSVSSAK